MARNRNLVPKSPELLAHQLDYVLLDGSGSMITKWDETLAGLDMYIKTLRGGNLHSHGILHVFDDMNLEYIQQDRVIAEWPKLDRSTVDLPAGGTPLYDAINLMVRRLAELAPQRCSIIIVTDGQEAGSTHTSLAEATSLLDWCRAQGWQVTFLGADFNNTRVARALGADKQTFIGVQKARMADATEQLAHKRLRYGATGDDIGFNDDEKKDFGGYLAGPSSEQ